MSKTRLQIRADVYRHMRDAQTDATLDPSFATKTEVNERIETERNLLYMEMSQWEPLPFLVQTDFTYLANAEFQALPAAAQNRTIYKVEGRTPGSGSSEKRRLMIVALRELNRYATDGEPIVVALWGPNIHARPKPGNDELMTLSYVPELTALADDSALPTEIPGELHQYFGYAVACSFKEDMNDPQDRLLVKRDRFHDAIETHFELMRGKGEKLEQLDSFIP